MASTYLTAEDHQALANEARQEWRADAACRGRPDLIRGGKGEDQRRRICFGCPVLDACRAWAMSLPPGADTDDIAGGMTAGQRTAARQRASQHKAAAGATETTGGTVTVHAINPATDDQPAAEQTAAEPVGIQHVGILLKRGEESEIPATRAAAKKTRAAIEDLRQRVANEAEEKRLRDELAELERQAAERRARLKEIAPKASQPRGSSVPDGVTPKQVRAWAAEKGITCPDSGRIPKFVVDQYLTAHGLADAS